MDPALRETSDSKIIVATSSAGNFFPEQALRSGLLASDFKRTEMMLNPDPIREVIQREIEKERIREEIINAEFARRRELEAEVRRELAFERELALRRDGVSMVTISSAPPMWTEPRFSMPNHGHGFGLGERVPFPARTELGPFERVPVQRRPEAPKVADSNKGQSGKAVIFSKPMASNVAGTKRKITAMDSADDSDMTSLKKKAQEWSCALCDVSATSERGLNMHLLGKKHRAKEARLNEETTKNTENSNTPEVKEGGSPALKKDKKLHLRDKKKLLSPDSKKRLFAFWCADCEIGCHCQIVMDAHIRGKKHVMKMEELKKAQGAPSTAKCADTKEASEEQDTKANVDGEVGEKNIEMEEQKEGRMASLVNPVVEARMETETGTD